MRSGDPFGSTKLRSNSLEGAVAVVQLLALESRRFTRQDFLNVGPGISRVQLPHTAYITCGTHAKPEISFVGPVLLVMSATETATGKVGDLVVFEAFCGQEFDTQLIHRQLVLFAEWIYCPALPLLPERGSLLIRQTVRGDVVGRKCHCLVQVALPGFES